MIYSVKTCSKEFCINSGIKSILWNRMVYLGVMHKKISEKNGRVRKIPEKNGRVRKMRCHNIDICSQVQKPAAKNSA